MTSVVLNVPSISCGHCARNITNALTPVAGVRDVQVNVAAKQVRVEYDEARVEVERLKTVLQEENYLVVSVELPKETAVREAVGQGTSLAPDGQASSCSCCSR
jgi:copper chaperone